MAAEPLRVGYVLKNYPRYSETFVVNEILAHEAAGLPVEIFSLRTLSDPHFQDIISRVRAPVTYIPVEPRKASDLWATMQTAGDVLPKFWRAVESTRREEMRNVYQAVLLAIEARRRGIRHLHAHFASVATSVTRLAARFGEIPFTFTAHAKDIFHESVSPTDLREKLSDAAGVVTVSDYNVDYLHDVFGGAARGVRRVYNGLDLEQFPFAVSGRRGHQIVAVGRLVEKKGFGDLIDACGILHERGVQFQCEMIGAGPLEGELRARIGELGLADRVQLLGPRPQREVMDHVRSASVFVAPCVDGTDGNRDGLPTVLLEAMALGTPCVSTRVTGIPEVVRDRETGRLVAQHDPVALAEAIAEILAERCVGELLAQRARQLMEANFDIHRNTAQLRRLFAGAAQTEAVAA